MGDYMPRQTSLALLVVILFLSVGCGSTNRPMATSMGDMRAERRISGDDLFEYHEIITLDGSNPSTHVGQTIYYGRPYVGLPSKLIRRTGGLVFPLWSRRDLNPSTAAFPIKHVDNEFSPTRLDLEDAAERNKWTKAEFAEVAKAEHLAQIRADKSGLKNDTYVEHREYVSPGRDVVAEIAEKIETIQQLELNKVSFELDLIKAQGIENNDTAIQAIQASIDTAATAIATKRGELQTLMKGKVAGVNNAGVLIIRWATDQEQGLSLDAGDLFKGGLDVGESRSGYLILGGVRFSSLVLGEDFLRTVGYQLDDSDSIPILKNMIKRRMVGVTKYMISAQHVAYVSDLQTKLNAQFTANISKTALKNLDSIDQIKLQYALSAVGSFNNMGQLGEPAVTKPAYVFGAPDKSGIKDQWMPIYSVIAVPKPVLFRKIETAFDNDTGL